MQLDYFLDKKVANKFNNDLIITYLFKTLKPKLNFSPHKAIQADEELTNYMSAYCINIFEPIYEEAYKMNLISLLYMEDQVENLDFSEVYQLVNQIILGAKTKSKLENFIYNLVEINRLIAKLDFKINEDNYELMVHLLLRNTELNLDRKANYFRNETNNLGFNIEIKTNNIEAEMRNIFEYGSDKFEDSLDGITKIIIIMLGIIIIEPHQKFNISLSFLVTNWYLKQNKITLLKSIDLWTLFNQWEKIVKVVNNCIENDMNFDEALVVVKTIIHQSFKKNYLNKLLSEWMEENHYTQKISLNEKMILLAFIQYNNDDVTKDEINKILSIGKWSVFEPKQVEKSLAKLCKLKLIQTKDVGLTYQAVNNDINKFKQMLK